MNERIRELALQVDLMRYPSDGINIRIEKFAELIIQECADIADMNTHQWDLPGKYIKQHFGVEE